MILNFNKFTQNTTLIKENSTSGGKYSWWNLDPSNDIEDYVITPEQAKQGDAQIIKQIKVYFNNNPQMRYQVEVNSFWTEDFSKTIRFWKYIFSGYNFPSGNKDGKKICRDFYKTLVYNRSGSTILSRIRDVAYRPNIIQQAWSNDPINNWANKYSASLLSNRQEFYSFNQRDLSFLNSTKGLNDWEKNTVFSEKMINEIFEMMTKNGKVSSQIPPGLTDGQTVFHKLSACLDQITKMDKEKLQKYKKT